MEGEWTSRRPATGVSAERPRVEPTHEFESEARRCGYRMIAGMDEAGRGPLAGPVVAAAVILPVRVQLPGVTDSKLLTEPVRTKLFEDIMLRAVAVGIGLAPVRASDEGNQPMLDARDAAEKPGDVAVVREMLDQVRNVFPGPDAARARLERVAADPPSGAPHSASPARPRPGRARVRRAG